MGKRRLFGLGIIGLAALLLFGGCKKNENTIAYINEGPQTAAKKFDDSTAIYNKKTLEFKNNGQLDIALSCSERAIEFGRRIGSKELGNAYFNRAKIFQELGQNNNAFASYDSATKYYLLIHEQYDGASKTALEMAELYKKLGNERLAENYRIKAKIWDIKSKDK